MLFYFFCLALIIAKISSALLDAGSLEAVVVAADAVAIAGSGVGCTTTSGSFAGAVSTTGAVSTAGAD
jgi:hypothetical protein